MRIPITGNNPKAKRLEFRCTGQLGQPVPQRSRHMLMAGIDGIKKKIEPLAPVDKDLYELPPEEARNIPQAPTSLETGHQPPRSRSRVPDRGWRPSPPT